MARKKPKNILSRGSRNFEQHSHILIVCEGEVTEPNYFKGLINKFKINVANVHIVGECGAAPISVYKEAERLYEKSKLKNEVKYDKVFCVFDRDEHNSYSNAISSIKNKDCFEAIISNPCFEVWYLFHFSNSSKPFHKKGSKTASQQVKSDAGTLLNTYGKNKNDISILYDKLPTAIENAKLIAKQGHENPYTNVYKIVESIITTQGKKI